MPFYDLRCKNCDEEFNVRASMVDKAEKRIPCPVCGSTDLATSFKFAPNYIRAGGAASEPVAACANSKTCSAACPHAHNSSVLSSI
ncbi:MAG: zinc ribbon domain-containing protein [Oscillospiraceae bacterium]|nr:zinc ribbon domain-containing protein [Oscillospiraceae bacterium]